MKYDVSNLTDFSLDTKRIKDVVNFTAKYLNVKDKYVSIVFCTNKYIQKINKDYRGKDAPTDVISFAFFDEDISKSSFLGEIYISVEKIEEQANSYNHSTEREMCFLLVHGLLHLLGYDHMKKEDEEVMFHIQEEILQELGVVR